MKNDNKNSDLRKTIHSRQHNRFCRKLLPVLIASCFACGYVIANPLGPVPNMVNGLPTATFTGLGTAALTIKNNPNAIINWQSFSIQAGEMTTFIQAPTSSVLNRVTGANGRIAPSEILGTLRSGQLNGTDFIPGGTVYLINPNGVLFGAHSQVNVGGLVASSLNMTDADFLAGKNTFNGSGLAGLVRLDSSNDDDDSGQAQITTASGGKIYLIAPKVINNGILTAPNGEIVLAGGHSVMLADENNPNLRVVISAPTNEFATNLGQIIAEAGRIGIYGGLVNLGEGTINADSAVTGPHGEIVLKSSQSSLNVKGTISAVNGTLILSASKADSNTANIVQTDPFNVAHLSAVVTNGNINLTNDENVFSTVSAKAGGSGNIALTNSGDITVGTVNSLAGITSTGLITLTSNDGSINTAPGATITGPSLDLYAYSGVGSQIAPLNTSVGTISVSNYNDGDIALSNTGVPLSVACITQENSGSIFINANFQPLTIDGQVITWNGDIGLLAGSIILNGPVYAAVENGGTVALEANGNITQTQSGPITADRFSVVSHTGSVKLDNTDNYVGTAEGIAGVSGEFSFKASNDFAIDTIPLVGANYSGGYFIPELSKITLFIGGETITKVYDGTTVVDLGEAVTGIPQGYQVTVEGSGTYATKNVGTDIAITATYDVTAPFLFELIKPAGLVGNITKKTVTVDGTVASSKTYDGTTAGTLSGGTLSGVIAADTNLVSLLQQGHFVTPNAGHGITVIANDELVGNAAGNYLLANQPTGLSADIARAPLTVIGEKVQSKIVDGTTAATVTGGTLVGVIPADSNLVGLTYSGSFITSNVGNNISVIISNSLSGPGAGNYTITRVVEPAGGFMANILPVTTMQIGPLPDPNYYSGLDRDDKSEGAIKNETDNSISCS